MSSKQRIYQVAKEFHISNEALIDFLTEHGFKVRNHMAPLTDIMLEKIHQHYGKVELEVSQETDFRKKIQAKKQEEEERKKAIRQEIDEILELSKSVEFYEQVTKAPKISQKKKVVEKPAKPKKSKVEEEAAAAKTEKLRKIALPPEEKAEIREKKKQEEPAVKKVLTEIQVPKIIDKIELKEEPGSDKSKGKPKRHLKKRPRIQEDDDELVAAKGVRHGDDLDKRKKRKVGETDSRDDDGGAKKKKKRRKRKKKPAVEIDEKEIEASIRETLAKMGETGKKKRRKKEREVEDSVEVDTNVIHTAEFISVADLAGLMDVESSEVIRACMSLGLMVSINQRLDKDTLLMVADEFGYELEFITEYGEEEIEKEDEDSPDELVPRPPVVTIMGHVDHGKTSLLDYIRKSNIIAGEAGGITQHIGAYEVAFHEKQITFLDTPGHEAFTAMRARGAQVTDIVVLVVAADDSVMPQTIEAINHARAAGVPMIVAINKVDKPAANPDAIRKQLADQNVLLEDWGGKVQSAEISAKTGQGVEELLDKILLEAEMLELKANPDANAKAVLIEAKMEKGRGTVSTIIIQRGTLQIGDIFVAGQFSGRIRAMFDERNHPVTEAPPSTPVLIVGFNGMPQAGDHLVVVESEQEAREISLKRQQLRREQSLRQHRRLTLDQISQRIAEGEVKELSIIIKADVDGSVEALSDSLMDLGNDDVSVRIIHKGVGAITEYDVLLAEASQAVIIGFHIAPTNKARDLASRGEIDIRLYKVIYDVVNDIKLALSGLLEPDKSESVVGSAEIREVFKASKIGNIAGCFILSGKINRNNQIRLIRDGKIVFEGKISSLKRFKEDVRDVASGYECGITIENYNDIKVNDVIEAYEIIETARTL
ncbi:translation initiation factor IF-2 [bacterium]|nr:translation initiation factor IF-2 [bacterium]